MTNDELVEKVARAIASPIMIKFDGWPRSKPVDWDHLTMASDQETITDIARAALAIAMPAAFEMAAKVAEKRAEARFADFGTTEPDTNASYYSGRRGETLDELDEEDWHIAQTIRAEGEKWK